MRSCKHCGAPDTRGGAKGMCKRCYHRAWEAEARSRRWSRVADACIACGRSDSRHARGGLCNRCWQSEWRRGPDGPRLMRMYQQRYAQTPEGKRVRADYAARETTRWRKWLDNLRRREEREGVWVPLPDGYVDAVKEVFEGRCARCGTTERLELDHHLPLEAGHRLLGNAVLLCRNCNARKHTRFPKRFYDPWTLLRVEIGLRETRDWLAANAEVSEAC